MATQDDPPTKIGELPLTVFELPKWLVEPAVRSCRLFNTALDFIFYDVPTLRAALAERDAPMQARGEIAWAKCSRSLIGSSAYPLGLVCQDTPPHRSSAALQEFPAA